MARELHDHAGQTLAALSMNLYAIETASSGGDGSLRKLASEAKQLSDDLSKEIRTLSYLLHPPLLDEVGLESAIRWYVEGFSERSRIKVELNLPEADLQVAARLGTRDISSCAGKSNERTSPFRQFVGL